MSKSNRAVLAALLTATVSTAAAAADLGGPRGSIKDAPPPIYSAPAYNWAGLYGGVFLGGANQNWTIDFYRGNNHGHADLGSTGIAYGAMLGYNMMLSPNFVVGIEADLGSSNASQTNEVFDNDLVYSTMDVFGSIRGRAGFAIDRLLIYGTAGLAFGRVTNDIQKGRNAGEQVVYDNQWLNGYVIGAGLEYALTGNLLGRVEYLYSNYGTVSLRNADGNLAEFQNDMHLVRVGLAYKF